MAPAPPALRTSSPSYQHVQGKPVQMHTSGVATLVGATPETHICPGSDVPPSPSPAPCSVGDMPSDLSVSLEEALRIFDCSLDTERLSQDGPDSGPMPADPTDTGAAVPPCPLTSLALPQELLTPDYTVPEIAYAILGLDQFVMGLQPHEPWGDAAMDLPPSQPAMAQQRGRKRGSSPSTEPPSKCRALAGSTGLPGGD